MGTVRIRVVFEDDGRILTESQVSQGLNQSWILLKPQHQSISDLSSYLAHFFDLHRSCPNGIFLSMDDFVLPPFESTCVLKDKDVIRVQRKGRRLRDVVKVDNGLNLSEDKGIVEKQPVITCAPLSVNVEFGKETGGYQIEPEEEEDTLLINNPSGGNAISKKRKASKKLQSPEKKKKRTMAPRDLENDFQMEHNESFNDDGLPCGKSVDKKQKVSDVRSEPQRASTSTNGDRNNDNVETLSKSKRFGKLQENGEACGDVPHTSDGTKKVPSRSSRRQYARRRWLKELKAEKKELDRLQQNGEAGGEIAADDETVPLITRPGYIRFEPLDAGQPAQQSLVSVETLQGNRITSKRRGTKWGRENFASSGRHDDKASNKEHFQMMTTDKGEPPNAPVDFDELAPLNRLPMEGEVIAYRLVELSSSWSPKLSTFRVGKTAWCDPKSKRILLTPLAGYPVILENQQDEDGYEQLEDYSPYGQDGSLEISFMSLIDVRVMNNVNSDPPKASSGWTKKAPIVNEATTWSAGPSNNYKQTHAPIEENEVSVWDKHVQAQSAKKAQVIHVNSRSNENSGSRPSTSRASRNSALAPSLALLRARNAM
ncbi:coilin-like isoform X1 [Rhododendron vialii]|uniref:coilin-like isoform X1 n=1 Tax=Rhododendron vialii TaxID=182163 RepID=UPI00265F0F21|nr:coilin-like isoform X1 [Rhododendron vialii]